MVSVTPNISYLIQPSRRPSGLSAYAAAGWNSNLPSNIQLRVPGRRERRDILQQFDV